MTSTVDLSKDYRGEEQTVVVTDMTADDITADDVTVDTLTAANATLTGDITVDDITADDVVIDDMTADDITADDCTFDVVTVGSIKVGSVTTKQTVFVGTHTTVWGAAAEAITIEGVAATDTAVVSLRNWGTSTRTIVSAVCTTNTLTVTFSGDPGNDAIVQYEILR